MPAEEVQTLRLTMLPSRSTRQTQQHSKAGYQGAGIVAVDSSLVERTTVYQQAEPQSLAILDMFLEGQAPLAPALVDQVDELPQAVLHKTSRGRHKQLLEQLEDL